MPNANRYRSQIWLAAVDGSTPPLPFTAGEHRDANPCWSPDGRRLAFTSRRDDPEHERTSVRVAPVATSSRAAAHPPTAASAPRSSWSSSRAT